MNKTTRQLAALVLLSAGIISSACSDSEGSSAGERSGTLNLPLTTQGASGVTYRLRHATFHVHNTYAFEAPAPSNSDAGGDSGGSVGDSVSSETDPSAASLNLSLPAGGYSVELDSGWSLEKVGPNGPEPVVATLLSGTSQWIWISRRSTSWAEYDFGIGGRELWLNGKLNIEINVQESVDGQAGTGAGQAGSSAIGTGAEESGSGGAYGAAGSQG